MVITLGQPPTSAGQLEARSSDPRHRVPRLIGTKPTKTRQNTAVNKAVHRPFTLLQR